jgi:hypothetical protein
MIKSCFTSLFILSLFTTFGQNNVLRGNESSVKHQPNNNEVHQKLNTIWESTFDNPAEWVLDHDAIDCSLDWTIGNDTCQGPFFIDTILSTSANDGWAMIDSDLYGSTTGGNDIEDAWLTTAAPLDLTGTPNVIVEFETFYKRYNYERPYLVVGIGDGLGNVLWPDLDPMTDISAMNNVFDIFPNWTDGTFTDNPQKIRININSALTGAVNEIYLRLNWTGQWGYAWFVDDFKVLEQALDDILIQNSWITNENTNGIQYAITPIDQVEANWSIGADVYNFGVNDQTNVIFDADFTSFSIADTKSLIEYDSTFAMGETGSQTLTVGLYAGTFNVVSDNETAGLEFANNTVLRNFEISDSLYAIDGVGVHPITELKLSSIGTTTYDGSPDGITLGAMYHIKQTTLVSGVRVMLAAGSEEGAWVFGSVIDSTEFWEANPSPLAISVEHYISATDLTNGYIDAYFATPLSLDPGVYYGATRLYSDDNTNNVYVVNDLTVDQPSYASGVNNKGITYSNGNAIGVRMLMNGGWLAVNENNLENIKIYPNPSNGLVTIATDLNESYVVEVIDIVGNIVYSSANSGSTTIDLTSVGSGMYIVTMSNEKSTISKRVVIQ